MEFTVLTKQEYHSFARQHRYRNYLNSYYAFEVKQAYGYENLLVGVKEQGQILCATGITLSPLLRFYRYAYAQRGFLIDYQDTRLLAFFTKELKRYLRKRRVIYLRLDPYVTYQEHDEDGTVVEGGFHHQYVIDHMKTNGYQHQGFTTGFTMDSQVRWMMVLDLNGKSEYQLLKDLNQRTRWSIHKAEKLGVEVRTLTEDEMDKFYNMMEYAARTRHFSNMPLSHYQKQREIYGSDRAKFLMAYIDCEKTRRRLNDTLATQYEELNDIEKMLTKMPNSKKYKNKKKAQQELIAASEKQWKELEQMEKQYGTIIDIAAAYFLLYEDELVYVASGAYDTFRSFNGPYAIQWCMIKEAIRLGISRYNFYGTSGNFQKDADDYGVYLFKKGFHAGVEELVGDFILPIRSWIYRCYRLLKR